MRQYIYTIGLVIALLLTSCEKNIKIDLDIPSERFITVNGIVIADEPILLLLSKNLPLLQSTDYWSMVLEEATVTIYLNDEEAEKRTITRAQKPWNLELRDLYTLGIEPYFYGAYNKELIYKSHLIPHAGDRLRIEVTASGCPTAHFEEQIPEAPKLTEIQVSVVKDEPRDLFDYSSLASKYTHAYEEMLHSIGLKGQEINGAHRFENLVNTQAYQRVVFTLHNQHKSQDYVLGIPKRIKHGYPAINPNVPPIGPEEEQETVQKFIDALLFRAERFAWIEDNAVFSLEARAICRATNKSLDIRQLDRMLDAVWFMPYISNISVHENGETIQVLLPLFHKRPYESKLEEERLFQVFAINPTYNAFAHKKYGDNELDNDVDITDDLQEGLGEHDITISNIHNGRGMILVATPASIKLN